MARIIVSAAPPKELSASTPSFPPRPEWSRLSNSRSLVTKCGRFLLITAVTAAMSSNFVFAQQQPNDDRCKAEDTNRQTDNKHAESGQTSTPDGNPSQKLSDCGGVLKPPPVGDSKMEKPAPQVGNTPVIKPGDQPKEQQNGQQPEK
ncbi:MULTISPECIES: hypothetical protein [unclassified Rhizobium]|uniref:hypothetical protein n=1 Tax=unclassified Rhizobium TaxID=2613769 RepID=UPI0033057912